MKFRNFISNKFEELTKTAVAKAAPVVKTEIAKTVSKSKDELTNYIFGTATVIAVVGVIILFGKPRLISSEPASNILSTAEDLASRVINITYNEVHVTNNYFKENLKGAN